MDPKLYRANNDRQRESVKELLYKFPYSNFKPLPNQRVLDIGCGPGDITVSLLYPYLAADSRMVGVDISAAMISHAREKYRFSPQFEFYEYDFECYDVDATRELGKFDKIFSFWTFHWVHNQEVALQNVYDLLKPGGEILFLFLPNNRVYEVYEKMVARPKWRKYLIVSKTSERTFQFSSDPRAQMIRLAKAVGFQDIKCTLQTKLYEVPSLISVERASRAVNPFIGIIPKNLRESFLSEWQTEVLKYLNKSSTNEGVYTIVDGKMTLYATKR